MYSGVGFWRVIVRTITRCRPSRRGWKRSYSDLELAEGGAGDRWVPEQPRGQECAQREPSMFRNVVDRVASNSACLSKGPIVASQGDFHACHDFLPVTRVWSQQRQSRTRLCFCNRKGILRSSAAGLDLVFAHRDERLSKTKFSNR